MKKQQQSLSLPLSEQELDELHDFLWERYLDDEKAFSLEMIDGIFCALAINPKTASPSEWLSVIFESDNVFESEKEAEYILGLLFRHHNRVMYLMRNLPEKVEKENIYIPLIFDPQEDEANFGEQWAKGFHLGTQYCSDDWDKALESDTEEAQNIAEILTLILLLELGHDPDDENNKISSDVRRELFVNLPVAVYTLYEYWHPKDNKNQIVSKITQKIGRNDPCPCGSGKKYKKCCDA
jgi:uncharacterized protein